MSDLATDVWSTLALDALPWRAAVVRGADLAVVAASAEFRAAAGGSALGASLVRAWPPVGRWVATALSRLTATVSRVEGRVELDGTPHRVRCDRLGDAAAAAVVLVTVAPAGAVSLAEVMDVCDDGVFEHDLVNQQVWLSARMSELLGLPAVAAVLDAAAARRHVHPHDLPLIAAALQAVADGDHDRLDVSYRVLATAGTSRWVRCRGKVVERDRGGRPRRVLGTVTDVSEVRAIEDELLEAEHRVTRAADGGQVGLWEVDLRTGRGWRSLRHAEIFDSVVALDPWTMPRFLEQVVPDDRAVVTAALATGQRGARVTFDCRIRRGDGEVRWIAASATGAIGADGEVAVLSGAVVDITEAKVAELAQVRAHAAVEARCGELERALVEAKTLVGLLTICMHCKSVRSSPDVWEHIEAFLAARTPARFSHGVCPTCTATHYPAPA